MLRLDSVTKHYGDVEVLDHATFVFPETGLVCVMGPSGSGKTTLLNLLAGFDRTYEGEIHADDLSLAGLDADALCEYRRADIGFVFQDYCLLTGFSSVENLLMATAFASEDEQAKRERAQEMLRKVGVAELSGRRVETLSGGQKQRVAIARALMADPRFIMADEPTGSLDRGTSNEIMALLREFSKQRLVLVITHDEKILSFADLVLNIEDGKILTTQDKRPLPKQDHPIHPTEIQKVQSLARDSVVLERETPTHSGQTRVPARYFSIALTYCKAHLVRFLTVAITVSLGILAVLLSLSTGNIERGSIADFENTNPVYGNGYIKVMGQSKGSPMTWLNKDGRIDNVYNQYELDHIQLKVNDHQEIMDKKVPTPKTDETLSYGVMPRRGKGEVALSPSLSKKFASNIRSLLGETLVLNANGSRYRLVVSGIFNAGYDDFLVSSDVEQKLYRNISNHPVYSVTYDVADLKDVTAVNRSLRQQGFMPQDASREVANFQATFSNIRRLFLSVAVLIVCVSLFLCVVLVVRLQLSRFREIGLMSALGFRSRDIARLILNENILLGCLSAAMSCVFLLVSLGVATILSFPISVGLTQFALSALTAFIAVLLISELASIPLLRADPAHALRQ